MGVGIKEPNDGITASSHDSENRRRNSLRVLRTLDLILFSPVAIILVALVAASTIAVPWHTAAADSYPALDPNLIFVNVRGSGHHEGNVVISGDKAVVTAIGDSNPTIDLVDSESDFTASFTITPSATAGLWESASIRVTPPPGSRYFSILVGVVSGTVLFHDIAVVPEPTTGVPLQPLFVDRFTDPALQGWTAARGVDRVALGGQDGFALRVASESSVEAGTGTRVPTPIQSVSPVTVKTELRPISGAPKFKIAIGWLDQKGKVLGFAPDWPDWSPYGQPLLPATISLWHPRRDNEIDLQFLGALQPSIAVVTRSYGKVKTTVLEPYTPGSSYQIRLGWTHANSARFHIRNPDGSAVDYSVDRGSGLGLFNDPFVNLSVKASAPLGASSSLELDGAQLTIPARTRFATNAADWRLNTLTWAILAWLVLYGLRTVALKTRSGGIKWPTPRGWFSYVTLWRATFVLAAAILAASMYTVTARWDGHPFDRLTQESAMYVINQYGVGDVYSRTGAVPDGAIRGATVSWSPAEFVYPPAMAEYFTVVAKTWSIHSNIRPITDGAFQAFWKLWFAFFLLIDAALLMVISGRLGGSARWNLLIGVAFALNPAMIFDAPLWGESNSLLLSAVLLALVGLIARKPKLMWGSIAVAVLIKQTATLMIPLIAIFAMRRFGLLRSATDAAFGLIVGFAAVAPMTLAGLHPDTVVSTTIGKLVDFGSSSTSYDTTVSADTFPIWVLFTGFDGLQGHDRLWASDRLTLGSSGITYAQAGLALFVIVTAWATWIAWRSARGVNPDYRRLLLAIGLVVIAYVALNTRTSGHYLTLAIPLLLLGLPVRARWSDFSTAAWITLISFISSYGLFMFIAGRGEWPHFVGLGSPSTNLISGIIYRIYVSDVFITLFAALLVVVLVQLLMRATTGFPRRDLPSVAMPGSTASAS